MDGHIALTVLRIVALALLSLVTLLYFATYIAQLVTDPNGLLPLMLDGFGLGIIWIIAAVAARRR